jgi:hypothetical protein
MLHSPSLSRAKANAMDVAKFTPRPTIHKRFVAYWDAQIRRDIEIPRSECASRRLPRWDARFYLLFFELVLTWWPFKRGSPTRG